MAQKFEVILAENLSKFQLFKTPWFEKHLLYSGNKSTRPLFDPMVFAADELKETFFDGKTLR